MIPILRFDPRETGLRRWLGSLEEQIMCVLWAEQRGTVKQTWRRICQDQAVGLTTVNTIMDRLVAKGLLERRHAPGSQARIYRPRCTEDEFIELQRAHVRAALEGEKQ